MNGLTEFAYLIPLANSNHDVVAPHEIKAAIRDMSAEEKAALADAYEAINRRDDASRISEWVHSCAGAQVPWDEHESAWEVRRLFVLFDHLAEAGIPPFSSRRVAFRERYKEPNWDELPQDLRFLADVTKAFSLYCGHDEHLMFHTSDAERETLGRTAEKIRASGGCERIIDLVIDHEGFVIVGRVVALIEFLGFAIS